MASKTRSRSKRCNIVGGYNWKHSHPTLTRNLCALSRYIGKIIVTGRNNCRTRKGNRSVKGSYHLYSKGCKAADIRTRNNRKALAWWARNVGGGRGTYCGRGFVHVDTGPNRTWAWYCKRRKRKA